MILLVIDISEFVKKRLQTGIQRVIKEFLFHALGDYTFFELKVVIWNEKENIFLEIKKEELKDFLLDIVNFKFSVLSKIDLFKNIPIEKRIFLDLDIIWNNKYKRENLYPTLKMNNYKIATFIYDLIPILYPDLFYKETKKNFPVYIDAVLKYSDLVCFDSYCAKKDFITYKEHTKCLRNIKMEVIYLGSDFSLSPNTPNTFYKNYFLLNKKYILFVGTLEPRKKHMDLLKAFEELNKKHPELYLIFIGRIGWHMEKTIKTFMEHPLFNKNFFILQDVDDYSLSLFYKNAFLVTYLSLYEGFGLPVVESLSYGNITLTYNNSSLAEIGKGYVVPINQKNSKKNLVKVISSFYENKKLYNMRKKYILQNYKMIKWSTFYTKFIKVLKEIT